MPSEDLVDLGSEWLEVRKVFSDLCATCPVFSEETRNTFHRDRDEWIDKNDKEVSRLSEKEGKARRRLLIKLLWMELRLGYEQRDVSARDCLGGLGELFEDALRLK